jgi:hypothetical protein
MDVWRNDGSRERKKTVSGKNVGQSITHHREARNEKGAAVKLHLIRVKLDLFQRPTIRDERGCS